MPVAIHGIRQYFTSTLETKERTYIIRCLAPDEVAKVYEIAASVYSEDELPSLKTFINIHEVASDLCLGYFDGEKIISFIWATRYYGSHITADTFDTHMPTGENVIIHAICTDPNWQRQGIALALLDAFTRHVRVSQVGAIRILMLCHAWHIPFFTRANFVFNGKSSLRLGRDLWYECELRLIPLSSFYIQPSDSTSGMEVNHTINSELSSDVHGTQFLDATLSRIKPCPTCGNCSLSPDHYVMSPITSHDLQMN